MFWISDAMVNIYDIVYNKNIEIRKSVSDFMIHKRWR